MAIKAGLGHDVWNAWPVLQSSFHFIVVADDSYVICMIFRSQGGCGRPTAGSAGDYPEEEEVAKEAVKSKVVFKMKKA